MESKILGLLAAGLLAVSTSAAGAVILDQDNFVVVRGTGGTTGADDPAFGRAQTFTVGVAGVLVSIEVAISQDFSVDTIRILQTAGGVPIGGAAGSVVLASSVVFSKPDPNNADLYRFDVRDAGLDVSVGDILAIELIGPTFPNLAWRLSSPYGLGSDFFFNTLFDVSLWTPASRDHDSAFRTYVDIGSEVTEPGTLALLAVGLAGLGFSRRRKAA